MEAEEEADPISVNSPAEVEEGEDNDYGFAVLGPTTEELEKNKLSKQNYQISFMKSKNAIEDKKIPISEFSSILSKNILDNLGAMGISEFFPVQKDVIPFSIKERAFGGDICVCAPTGSGKTLTYAVPVVQILQNRVIRKLRVVVLVPTRDLVNQVKTVFDQLTIGTQLRLVAISGHTSFKMEQILLVDPISKERYEKWLQYASNKIF